MAKVTQRRAVALLTAVALAAGLTVFAGSPAAVATPASPVPAAPVCGVADPATMNQTLSPQPPQATVVASGFPVSALVATSTTLYALDSSNRTMRIFTLAGSPQVTFQVGWGIGANSFAVDDVGNIYLARYPSTLVKVGPTGSEIWSRNHAQQIDGIYGMGTGANFRVGVVLRTVAGSTQYDSGGTGTGNSSITGTAFSPAPGGGLVSTDGNYVYQYSSTGVEQVRFGDPGTVSDQQFTGGPYHFFQQGGAFADATNRIYVADATRGIHGVSANGYFRGTADEIVPGSNPVVFGIGYLTERSWMAPVGTDVYFATGGRFQPSQSISKISMANLEALVTRPKQPNPILGFGAGVRSNAVGQYFPSGTTPSVFATFDPWWLARASQLSLRYTVRNRVQTTTQAIVAPTAIPMPTTAAGLANVPLTLPPAQPGAYEIHVELVEAGTVVGATCYRYAVGAPGHQLDFATLPPGTGFGGPVPARGVALADQLGVNALRMTVLWDTLLPSGVNGPMNFAAYDATLTAAASEAAARGVALFVQVGSGLGMEQNLVNLDTWGTRVQELVSHYQNMGVQITGWEAWSEPNNNYGGTPQDYVDKILTPFYNAVKAGDPDSLVIGGGVLGMDLYYINAVGQAGAYSKMDVVSLHPYTGHNRPLEEQGIVENLRDMKDILARYNAQNLPLWITESAWWSDGPGNHYAQADKVARTHLWNRALGIERWSYLLLEAGYGDFNLSYSFIQAAIQPDYVKPSALASMTIELLTGTRPFTGMLRTGIPHAYAASFGAPQSGTGSLVAVWTDDIDVPASMVVSAGGPVNLTITDVSGASTNQNVNSNTPTAIQLSGSPQYITVPAGASLKIVPTTAFSANVALAAMGATATASSATGTTPASKAIDGLPSGRLARFSDLDGSEAGNFNFLPAWASAPGDNAPSLTVTLAQATNLDRVVVLSHSNGSITPSLRNYTVEVQSGGVWQNVGTFTDQFFDRGALVSFTPRSVTHIRVSVSLVNYNGYTGGTAPWFWPSDAGNLADASQPWFGPAIIYEIEAYGPTANGVSPNTPAPDFDADNHTDRSVFRNGTWFAFNKPTSFFGQPGDIPVPGDYDGDGDDERAVYRNGTWFIEGQAPVFLGFASDIPVPGDYDGDGDTEAAIYRPSVGGWYVGGQATVFHGLANDIPVPGDYDGNGITDRAVWRPDFGGWYIHNQPTVFQGLNGDIPVPGDYDGDGDTDKAIWRPSVGGWYVQGQTTAFLGLNGDVPQPGDIDGNGSTDKVIWRPAFGGWYVLNQPTVFLGLSSDTPLLLPYAIYDRFF